MEQQYKRRKGKMKKRYTLFLMLVILCIIFSGIVYGNIHSRNIEKAYLARQEDPDTHDIESVLEYKSRYLGDNSNTINLFYHLPMYIPSEKFQIDSEKCTLKIIYAESFSDIGEEKVQKSMIYNSAAAFALIDNLTAITYEYKDRSDTFSRTEFENLLGIPLSSVLDKTEWEEKVQGNLRNLKEKFYNN